MMGRLESLHPTLRKGAKDGAPELLVWVREGGSLREYPTLPR